MAKGPATDLAVAEKLIRNFTKGEILEAAAFHGDIGEDKKTLDKLASLEQAKVLTDDEKVKIELRELGQKYQNNFGMKFLVSAADKTGSELLKLLQERIGNSESDEIQNAREELLKITLRRMDLHPFNSLYQDLEKARKKHEIRSAQITLITPQGHQNLALGEAKKTTWFEMASLSKSVASAFAIEYFKKKNIPLTTSVNSLLPELGLDPKVEIQHLMGHCALNLHYVNGVPANRQCLRSLNS